MKLLGFILIAIVLPLLLSEFMSLCPSIARAIVRRAAGCMPRRHRERFQHEWLAELNFLEGNGRLAQVLLALRIFFCAPSASREVTGAPPLYVAACVRALDVLGATGLVVACLPVGVFTALAIWIEDGRPIFNRQRLVGMGGKRFCALSFRSMKIDARILRQSKSGAITSCVTRVGWFMRSTCIDELPQLLNVVRGDMSFVGPRPEREHVIDEMSKKLPGYERRLTVRPGLTGLAQVETPFSLDDDQQRKKLDDDLRYLTGT